MVTYKKILELVAKREMGILGHRKTVEIFNQIGVTLNSDGSLNGLDADFDTLDSLITLLNQKYGPVPVMGCKIAVKRLAKRGGLELPDLLV